MGGILERLIGGVLYEDRNRETLECTNTTVTNTDSTHLFLLYFLFHFDHLASYVDKEHQIVRRTRRKILTVFNSKDARIFLALI